MNKFQKVGLAVTFVASMAFAQAMWTVNAPYGQVQFPWVVECQSKPGFDESNENDDCYKKQGGWWFGYLAGWEATGEVGPKKCVGAAGMPPDGGSTQGVNKVEAKINGEWVDFAGADYEKCEGPAITDKTNGQSLMSPDGLELRLTVGSGFILDPDYEPSLSGFGVNFGEYPTKVAEKDLDSKGGFCLTYVSDHENTRNGNTGAQMTLALGWDEGIKGNLVKGFDTWYAVIPPSNGQKVTKDFTWTGPNQITGVDPTIPNEAGMFIQDNWTNWEANKGKPTGAPFPITSATKEMTSVKISFSGYEAKVVNFKLIEFGFAGTCTGGGSTPIIAGGNRVNPVSFGMSGKVLSLNSSFGKPVVVQVINLQGAIVQTKTMSKGDKMSLQNLPTGIYMVRVPAQGYVAKYAIK